MKKLLLTILLLTLPSVSFAALTFGAVNTDLINVPATGRINNFTSFTAIGWVRVTTFTTGGRTIFAKGAAGALKRGNWTVAGLFDTQVDRGTTDSIATTNAFALNTWYCLATTYSEADGIRIYSKTSTTTMTENSYSARVAGAGSTVSESANPFRIGNNNNGTAAHIGNIGDFAYFNRVLTLGEMKTWCAKPQNLPAGKPAFWYKLGFTGTSNVIDLSGNKINGTITGAKIFKHQPSVAF